MNCRERFISACRGLTVGRHPVWLMRQAGRYLPEYRDLREKYDFVTLCRRPDLIFEISLQPWRRFKMDAVIVFSDILIPLTAMGPRLTFEENLGPQLEFSVNTLEDVKRLSIPNPRLSLGYVLEALENIRSEIQNEAALLGFIGAPWTLAAYMIAQNGRNLHKAVELLKNSPEVVMKLLDKITNTIIAYAVEKLRAGCDAIQIFDTWGGLLSPAEYRKHALPYLIKVVSEIQKTGKPVILFIKNSSVLLQEMLSSGANVLSVGSDIPIKTAIEKISGRAAIQGNLDPEILLRSPSSVERETKKLLADVGDCKGYIANLGHGVLPKTPVESVGAFVKTVKEYNCK